MNSGLVDPTTRGEYWENVHHGKPQDGVSWWQSVPELSLGLVEATGVGQSEPVIDVGAGWSTLVDHLVVRGYQDVTAIDLSATALKAVRDRLGDGGQDVVLQVADVLDFHPDRRFQLWHDRAVFHFLIDEEEREDYRASLARSLKPGGWAIVATFGPDGPLTCSGLPIVRYTHAALAAEFADSFDLVDTAGEVHLTPWGSEQQFAAVLLRHRG